MLAAMLMIALGAASQEAGENSQEDVFSCDTDVMEKILFETHPEMVEEAAFYREQLNQETRAFEAANASRRDGEPYIIPVVFHVVHNFGPENISNAQIENAIQVMNEDFRALNPEISTVHPNYADLVADVGIEFRLAQIDPDGNCTNGIVRTVHPATSEGSNVLKLISPIWDRSSYMNVWVCRNIASGAAAYAYYPSSLAGDFGLVNDGIVTRHDYLGAIGTSNAQRSHTMSHEVGHWLNLMHLWGNSNNPGSEDNCDMDDGVEDTPLTRGWTSCNVNGESCGSHDNVENYMEYAFCMKMFTEGQKERMLAALESTVASRNSLWQEENLMATGVLQEAGPCNAQFTASTTTICAGESITFQDQSFSNISSRFWIFEGGTPAVSTSDSPQVTFNQPGTYTVSIAVGDGNTSLTEVKTNYIRVLEPAVNTVPLEEGFEDYDTFNSVDQDWYTEPEFHAGLPWEVTTAAAYSGNKSAMIRGYNNISGASASLMSKTFDLTGIDSSTAAITFKYAYAPTNEESNDVLRVWAKRDCDSPWSLRRTIAGSNLNTVGAFVQWEFEPTGTADWAEGVVSNLVSPFLTDEFRLKFEFLSEGGNNLYLDDIQIFDAVLLSTDTDDLSPFGDITLYPNPSSGELNLGLDVPASAGKLAISVYDLSGRMVHNVYTGQLSAGPQVVRGEMGHLQAGVYLVVVESGNLGRQTKRWILSR